MMDMPLPQAVEQISQYLSAGRLLAAAELCHLLLQNYPQEAEPYRLRGVIALMQGHYAEAADWVRQALARAPDSADYHDTLGCCLALGQRAEEAISCHRRALELRPDFAQAENNLGNALLQTQRLVEAEAAFRRAWQLRPDYLTAAENLGTALLKLNRLADAIDHCQAVLTRHPNSGKTHLNLGIAFHEAGRLVEASAAYQQAARFPATEAEAYNGLGAVLQGQDRFTEAIACHRKALQLRPKLVESMNNLGSVLKYQGRIDEASQLFRQAALLAPQTPAIHSNVVFCELYRPGLSPAELLRMHQDWDQRHATPARASWPSWSNPRDPHKPLRLGFVSPNFNQHPVAFFLIRCLEHLSQAEFPCVCYSDYRGTEDAFTRRIQTAATTVRQTARLSDTELAEQIRADGIDILFDLAGHTSNNRLLLFARKPAPIQIAWIGYPSTTGLTALDYLVADERLIPPGSEGHYQEKVLRLPDVNVCWEPPRDAPPVGPLPAREQGFVTFGSFNNLAKINPQVIVVWAKILQRVPRSRLILKYHGLNDTGTADLFWRQFDSHGIPADRLELQAPAPFADMLKEYQRIDIALDPFPFGGGMTTCLALWMGAPVLTCPGATFASRQSFSYLTALGLSETVAHDLDDYVERAVRLAGDLDRLTSLRSTLRQRLADSPLCDGPRFAGNFMSSLRRVWREWCAG
ncbi:MAG: tetratricopeptide repeat protein [Gemmataceae bacterium]